MLAHTFQRLKIVTLLGLVALPMLAMSQVKVMGARISKEPHETRVVFEFDKAFDFKWYTLKQPPRLVVDIPDSGLQTDLKSLSIPAQSNIKSIRSGYPQPDQLRVVFDLHSTSKVKGLLLKPKAQYGYRLLLNIADSNPASQVNSKISTSQPTLKPIATAKPKTVKPKTVKPKTVKPKTVKWSKPKPLKPKNLKPVMAVDTHRIRKGRNIIVVIDPGHGGKDPGATGPRGSHEKHVVLAISKYLKQYINKVPGMTAKLTRKGDYYITLRERLRIARRENADFFVAVHADAFHRHSAKGASVFALSERGATSEAARWLAEKENYSELGGVYLANKSRELRSVLIDLSQTATIAESLQGGHNVFRSLETITPMHTNKVEQARFVVLKSPDIPSLLVETGFLSNPYEEKRLNAPWYQQKTAKAIAEGIIQYFRQSPPSDTLFALQAGATKYRVKQQDTWQQVAKQHYVSVRALKKMNAMNHTNHKRSRVLRVGQVITVPEIKS